MNRKNSRSQKKLAILPIMLVIMLLTTGAAYAYWYDTLTIDGDITTSDFSVVISIPVEGHGDDETKDIVDIGYSNIVVDPGQISCTITLTGAYPCWHGWYRLGVESTGTVPVHITGYTIDPNPDELDIWVTNEAGGTPFVDANGDPIQLHFGGEYFFLLHIHVFEDDEATPPILPEQGATYTFTITITCIQYNYNGL